MMDSQIPVKVFVQASYTQRQVGCFRLLEFLQSLSSWPQMPRPFTCWHEFMSESIRENGDGRTETSKAERNEGDDPVQPSHFPEAWGGHDSPAYKVPSPGRRLFLPRGRSGYVCEGEESKKWKWLSDLWPSGASSALVNVQPVLMLTCWRVLGCIKLPAKKKWLSPKGPFFLTNEKRLTSTPRRAKRHQGSTFWVCCVKIKPVSLLSRQLWVALTITSVHSMLMSYQYRRVIP